MNPVSARHRVDSAEQNPRCSDEYARGQGSTSVSGPLTAVRGGAGQEGTDDDKRCANCSDDAPMVGAGRGVYCDVQGCAGLNERVCGVAGDRTRPGLRPAEVQWVPTAYAVAQGRQ